jgi:hypothetical protein
LKKEWKKKLVTLKILTMCMLKNKRMRKMKKMRKKGKWKKLKRNE